MQNNCFIYETLNPVMEMKRTTEGGLMTLSGVFGVCGVRNNNKRIYEKGNYAKCVHEMQQRIKENGGIPGELEHPQTMNITLENVSHKITSIDINEDGVVTGEIQLLNTPKGKIAQAIVEGGLPLFVSSRAMGNIDQQGHVTLEAISSFDLVGTPGFSQAKMHLNESQVCEALDDNTWVVMEKEQKDALENTEKEINENKENMEDISAQIDLLEARITALEEENINLRDELDEAKENKIDLQLLAEGIQKWVVEEYSAELQKWLTEELQPEIIKESRKDFVETVSPKIQDWVTEEFAPEVEKWVVEQVAPGIQGWIVEHFAPQVENWLNEEYMGSIEKKISESIQESKDNKLKSISDTLNLLESMDVTKPKYHGRQVNETVENEPVYVANMPESLRPKYNMASQEVKESISRRAKLYDFNSEGAIERFWENINFEDIKPANESYRDLNTIEDQKERMIRESFRRRRSL